MVWMTHFIPRGIKVDGLRKKEARFASLEALPFQCRCLGSPVVVVVARDGDVADLASALRLRTRAPADLHHALEVNVHRVGELERLKKKRFVFEISWLNTYSLG